MGLQMRPIALRIDNIRQSPGSLRAPFTTGQGYHPPFRSGRDFSRIKCFSCCQLGHTQARCPKPDSTLPYKPAGWNMQSDSQQHQNITPPQGNSIYTGTSPIPVWIQYIRAPFHLHPLIRHSVTQARTQISSNWLRRQAFCSVSGPDRYCTDRCVHNSDCWWFDCTRPLCCWGGVICLYQRHRPVSRWTGWIRWILNMWMIPSYIFQERDTGSSRDGSATIRSLVDAGSSVTAMSDYLYQTLVRAGAPVGVLRSTSRTLRGANGTPIGISGCSHCVVSFMGLQTEFSWAQMPSLELTR